jgi:glyoxylase-like metal-dependent hydrolase (beta-lactamase superfamily II)
MALEQILPSLYRVPLRGVNAFLIDVGDEGLVLIDAGTPGDAGRILDAVGELGRGPADVRHILVTHCHVDHAGGLAELKEATGAPAYMHPTDAEMVRSGRALRLLKPTPGIFNRATFWLLLRNAPSMLRATEVEHEVLDGEVLALAGGIRAVHVPGHCAGQLAFLWSGGGHGGVLFAADAATNVAGLRLSPAHEDLEEGKRSAKKLAGLDFEAACFGHGRAIPRGASERFGKAFEANLATPATR